ncbi:hypothetical protein NEOC65_000091 [Neochlamydia sp. AcF65]|nr:hypothetical protein [Neochlamydia sp. AcF65]
MNVGLYVCVIASLLNRFICQFKFEQGNSFIAIFSFEVLG